jgi:predicted neuraminidase
MQKNLTSIVFTVLVGLLALSAWLGDTSRALSWRFVNPWTQPTGYNQQASYRHGFIFRQGPTVSVHAPSIAALSDGALMAVWYGGSREGAGDVSLYTSRLEQGVQEWTVPRVLVSRQQLAHDLGRHIRKLGNAVLLADGKQTVWMFFVSTSAGGWSTSAINLMMSRDNGKSWGAATRLTSSPFLNISTLVKGHPFFYTDGTVGLPVYDELLGKFSSLLRVDANGVVLDKRRMTKLRKAIQPDMALLRGNRLQSMMRNTGSSRVVLQQFSDDGGKSWSPLVETKLPNPDAAVSVTAVKDALMLVYNDSPDDRDRMALAISRDRGKSWKKFFQLEKGGVDEQGNKEEFSYPYLIRTNEGVYHLVYTWKRQRIAHVSFNDAWIGKQLR